MSNTKTTMSKLNGVQKVVFMKGDLIHIKARNIWGLKKAQPGSWPGPWIVARHTDWPGPRTGQATDWPGPRTGQAHGLARPTDWPGPRIRSRHLKGDVNEF